MRNILVLILSLVSITYTQAQNWINNESTLLYEDNLKSNENSQCIEEYDIHHLLTTTNKIGTNRYAFRLWDINDSVKEGFLNDPRQIISDIEIFDDSVYFCGYRIVNGTNVGYIGRFSMQQFINNQSCGYEILDITTSSKLKKLVAYESNNRDHIVAIGTNTSDNPIVVDLFPDSVCNIFENIALQYERLSDIAVGEKYVVITGEDTGSAKITLTRFLAEDLSNYSLGYHEHNKYDYTNVVDIAPFMLEADQVKISYLDSCRMAITTTAMDYSNNGFYTLISVFNEHHLNILNTQVVPHNDKMIYLRDTEYDSIARMLYVLEDNNLDNTGYFTSYTLPLDPYSQIPYPIEAIKNAKDYKLNDIIAFSLGNKFIGVGVNVNPFQGLFSKDIRITTQHCNDVKILKPLILGQVSKISATQYGNPNFYPINWQQNNFNVNNYPQMIECQSHY